VTQREINKVIRKWKKILRLEDWIITAEKFKSTSDSLAKCSITSERKTCRISLFFPHQDLDGTEQNIETSIVHEMVHIYFDPFWPNDPDKQRAKVLLIEHAVDALSEALVRCSCPKTT